jgi:hypothetical protein
LMTCQVLDEIRAREKKAERRLLRTAPAAGAVQARKKFDVDQVCKRGGRAAFLGGISRRPQEFPVESTAMTAPPSPARRAASCSRTSISTRTTRTSPVRRPPTATPPNPRKWASPCRPPASHLPRVHSLAKPVWNDARQGRTTRAGWALSGRGPPPQARRSARPLATAAEAEAEAAPPLMASCLPCSPDGWARLPSRYPTSACEAPLAWTWRLTPRCALC